MDMVVAAANSIEPMFRRLDIDHDGFISLPRIIRMKFNVPFGEPQSPAFRGLSLRWLPEPVIDSDEQTRRLVVIRIQPGRLFVEFRCLRQVAALE